MTFHIKCYCCIVMFLTQALGWDGRQGCSRQPQIKERTPPADPFPARLFPWRTALRPQGVTQQTLVSSQGRAWKGCRGHETEGPASGARPRLAAQAAGERLMASARRGAGALRPGLPRRPVMREALPGGVCGGPGSSPSRERRGLWTGAGAGRSTRRGAAEALPWVSGHGGRRQLALPCVSGHGGRWRRCPV